MKTQNLLGILSSEVPTGNLLWVDAVNGIDALAVRGRMTIPFKTLTKAKESAVAGDTIIVLPGTYYDERNLLKNWVNWHFLPGAKVQVNGTGGGAIFDTGTGSGIVSKITGYGDFSISVADSSANVVNCAADGSDLLIQGIRLNGGSTADTVRQAGGNLKLEIIGKIECTGAHALFLTNGACVARAQELHVSSGYPCVRCDGGTLNLDVWCISGSTASTGAVHIYSGSGAVVIRAFEIVHNTDAPVVLYAATGSVTLTIIGARIQSLGTGYYSYAVQIAGSGASGKVRLMNCVLLPGDGTEEAIRADTVGTVVQFHGVSVGNGSLSNVTPCPSNGCYYPDGGLS